MQVKEIFILSILFIYAIELTGQRIVPIEPGVNTIGNTISADTTETGDRVDQNTIYELRRNGVYKTQFEITNIGFPLHIRAEAGEGSMPILQTTPFEGGEIPRPFTIQNDLTIEGIYITSYSDNINFNTRIIRATNRGARVILRDCWIDGSGQSAVRFDSPGAFLIMENCVVSHIGRPDNTGNGRVIDVRGDGGVGADTLIIRNNTFYNITRRLVRFNGGLGSYYMEVDHNTFVNSIVQFTYFDQSVKVRITNNLLVNPSVEGLARQSSIDLIKADELNTQSIYDSAGFTDLDREVFISNNWLHYQPNLEQQWADSLVSPPDVYDEDIYLDITQQNGEQLEGNAELAEELLNAEPYLFEGPVQFVNAPTVGAALIAGVIQDSRTQTDRVGTAPIWNYTLSPFYRVFDGDLEFPWDFPYDFSYDISSGAATAATDGGPVGDPRWTPRNIEIIVGIDPDIEDFDDGSVYPNPVRDVLFLNTRSNYQEAQIYSISGKMIYRETKPKTPIDMSTIPSGVYLLILRDSDDRIEQFKIIKE